MNGGPFNREGYATIEDSQKGPAFVSEGTANVYGFATHSLRSTCFANMVKGKCRGFLMFTFRILL